MSDNMETDLELLLDLAAQHDRVAEDILQWAQQPTDWLNKFPETYGKIAHPVYEALTKYYTARQSAGEALADGHNKTADALRASAQAYQRADQDGAAHINRAGDPFAGHTGPSGTTPPTGPGGPTMSNGSGGPGSSPSTHGAVPTGTAPGGPLAGGPTTSGPETSGPTAGSLLGQDPGSGHGPGTFGGNGTVPPGFTGSGTVPSYGSGIGALGGAPGPLPPGGPGSTPPPGPNDLIPVMPTPFAEAVAAARQQQDDPAHVVNGATDDDLLIARTLLSAVLATVEESVAGTAWAVSVMRGAAGAGVFITSNEGRGWLPPAVFLPREVSTPWLWDEVLDPDRTGEGSPWEGVSDPARVLVEFGLAWGPLADAKLSALASSAPIDAGLRAQFSDVPMQGLVGPAYDVDLRVFTPDTADRLGLTGSTTTLELVAAIDDSSVRSRCAELAADAHAQVVRTAPDTPEVVALRRLREAILTSINEGRPIPRTLWQDLRDADDLLAASLLSRRVDVGRVDVGALRVDDEVGALRTLAFERRCNELLLALASEDSTRQSLRDAVYAHAQVVEHPQFVPAPVAVSAPEAERVARSVVAGGSVSAPVVTAGPPSGAVAAAPVEVPPSVVIPGMTQDPN